MLDQASTLGLMALLSFVSTRGLIPFSYKVGLLDRPDVRKRHSGVVPMVGGIAIFLSVLVGAFLMLQLSETFVFVGIICGIITLVGAFDDRYPAHPVHRLLLQLLAGASIAALGGVALNDLGDLFGQGAVILGVFAIPFTAIAITGMCNAINMVDGIDGLAAGLGLIALTSVAVLVSVNGATDELMLIVFFCVALCVFLIFNLQLFPAVGPKIFLGDAGSMLIGCVVAVSLIYFSQGEGRVFRPVTALWLAAVPLMDMVSTMMRRVSKGRSPFYPDRTHLHHILQRAGFSSKEALLCILMLSILMSLLGVGLEKFWPQKDYISFAIFLSLFTLYYLYMIKRAFVFTVKVRRMVRKHWR